MKRPDHVEIVAIAVPVLCEFIAVSLFIATFALAILYFGGLLELPA